MVVAVRLVTGIVSDVHCRPTCRNRNGDAQPRKGRPHDLEREDFFHSDEDRFAATRVQDSMKLTRDLVPLAFTVFSGFACTPSSNRGPTVGTSNDAAKESSREVSADLSDTQQASSLSGSPPTDPGPVAAPGPLTQPAPRPIVLPRPTGPYRVRIVNAGMRDLPTFFHDGRSYVLGAIGERYAVVVSNPTPQRVEAVISIDGLDAIDGTPADYVHKRGYILAAYGSATIEGFRTSLDQVATFRFSSVAESYAGRLGQARDVGVVGVAFFPERAPVPVAVPQPWAAGSPSSPPAARKSEAAPAPATPTAPPAAADQARPSASGALSRRDAEQRRGLGTEFGEARESHVEETLFSRADPGSPSEVVTFRYNDRAGLMALGIRVDPPVIADSEIHLRETADPFRANRFAAPPP